MTTNQNNDAVNLFCRSCGSMIAARMYIGVSTFISHTLVCANNRILLASFELVCWRSLSA